MDILIKYKKVLIIVAVVLIVAEVAWAVYTLTRPVTKESVTQSVSSSQAQPIASGSIASIILQGPTQAKIGDTFKVDIQLKANSLTDGTDLIIKFDPNILEVVQTNKKAIDVGKIYQDYPVNIVDEKGLIVVSGVTLNKNFIDQGSFGTISFKAKATGIVKISVDYTEKSTTDSNVTESSTGTDILKSVTNLDVKID